MMHFKERIHAAIKMGLSEAIDADVNPSAASIALNVEAILEPDPYRDRAGDVSVELTEVRTVLKRAETALSAIRCRPGYLNNNRRADGSLPYYLDEPDADREEMIDTLEMVVWLLSPWRQSTAARREAKKREKGGA